MLKKADRIFFFFGAVAISKKWIELCETSLLCGTDTAPSMLAWSSLHPYETSGIWPCETKSWSAFCFFLATLSVGLIRYIASPWEMLPSHSCNYRDLQLPWKELHDCMGRCNKRWPELFTAGEQGPVLPNIPWLQQRFLRQPWIRLQMMSCWKTII